jgi:hypothetical protein
MNQTDVVTSAHDVIARTIKNHVTLKTSYNDDADVILDALNSAGYVLLHRRTMLREIDKCKSTSVGSTIHNRVVRMVRDAVLRVSNQ